MMRLIVRLLFLLAIFGCAPANARSDKAAAILSANRVATGPAATGTVILTYRYVGQGLVGETVSRFDATSGNFVYASDFGVMKVANGFDGRIPWMRDLSGATTAQEGGDRIPLAINEAYRNANLWWRADRGGAKVAYMGREPIEGRPAERLSITPRRGLRFDAWFDARTHLLVAIAERQMFFDTRTYYRNPERRGHVMVPTRIISDGGTGTANYATLTLVRTTSAQAEPPSHYAQPVADLTDVTIDGDRRTTTIPFRLLNNHIYVEASVNGKGPYTFIVDTGGHTILSSRVVREAALTSAGVTPAAGAGEKIATSGYAAVDEIAIGAIRMHHQTAITMDIYDPAIEGIRVDGMVGFEVFRRLAVRIDYGTKTLTFTRFEDFDPGDAGTAIPFKFYDHLPQVTGRLGGIPALFDIDTGSRSEVDLTSPFVRRHRLEKIFPNGVTAMTGWGVGGPSFSQVVRAPALSLGPVAIEAPIAGLSRASAGSFSDANFDGNIGSGLLKRFVASFDYSRQLMYLKRIVPAPADVGTFDRSGMWLNAAESGFVVAHVTPGGPAAAAGIVKGDLVESIDGRPAVVADLSDARALLRTRPGGTRIALMLRRDGRRIPMELTLRDSVPPLAPRGGRR